MPVEVRMFTLAEWRCIEVLVAARLAECGIIIDPSDFTDAPVDSPSEKSVLRTSAGSPSCAGCLFSLNIASGGSEPDWL